MLKQRDSEIDQVSARCEHLIQDQKRSSTFTHNLMLSTRQTVMGAVGVALSFSLYFIAEHLS